MVARARKAPFTAMGIFRLGGFHIKLCKRTRALVLLWISLQKIFFKIFSKMVKFWKIFFMLE
jgi:hypothetical protein